MFNGKITMFNGKITMFNGKITIFNGKITIFNGKITIFNGKINYKFGPLSIATFNRPLGTSLRGFASRLALRAARGIRIRTVTVVAMWVMTRGNLGNVGS